MIPGHDRACHCAECAPCKHHPGEDCGCWCRFASCSPENCPEDGEGSGVRGPGPGQNEDLAKDGDGSCETEER